MWYETSYRRHLCDMHIEDWNEDFLSKFSPEDYFENLKHANIQNAMVYFQSHVGYCYYPTASGHMHRAFVGDEGKMKRLVDLCRDNGIRVTGYYSLIYNTWAHDVYPQWRMVGQDGRSQREAMREKGQTISAGEAAKQRYGLCCPNNKDYRTFVFQQIDEMMDYFTFDGMFFDMLFWPHFCYCESCKKRWEKEVGGELPKNEDWSDSHWRLHVHKRREWMGEFAQTMTDYVKTKRPEVSVEHNFASGVLPGWHLCAAEGVNNACDYTGGDLYGGILEQSFTCKFYRNISRNQPFEYMFSRCNPNLQSHTVTKSEDMMKTAVFLTLAHHGATLVIAAIDPAGTMDERVYERIGKVFASSKRYEPFLKGEMIEDVGVYYSLRSKFNAQGDGYTNHTCCVNAVKTLIENHVSVGVTGGYHDLSKYKVLVVPCLTEEDAYDNERILSFVREGGNIYLNGGCNRPLVEELLGAKVCGYTKESMTYLAPLTGEKGIFGYFNAEYPLSFEGRAAIVEGILDVLATITLPYTAQDNLQYASIHSNPPGVATAYPAVVTKRYGKGRVIWSAVPVEASTIWEYKQIFIKFIDNLLPERSIQSNAPRTVELTAFEEEGAVTVSAVYLNEEYFADTIKGFEIRVRSNRPAKAVLLLPEKTLVDTCYQDGFVCFEARDLHIYDQYRIEF